ncbi:uncharacterized protein EAE97_005955 [Botrytis byssoidea]|uniref:BTB domain-containing protein n=1 Tax=Botrytis byssoidea TaxID=139641 RepID=A0A9P5M6U9_9HELO|nr:uncharacterized protein EAE97_005955 [Botrytis byssoidea]KAF7943885.1 hypothetical protein EAE97_005955 [Botrytis byssoidea]
MNCCEEETPTFLKFHVRRQLPEMRIKLFGHTELQVHSSILKEHSDFFFKFLDSPEKLESKDSEWKYNWVSEVEDDGEWHLVAKQNMQPSLADNDLGDENAEYPDPSILFHPQCDVQNYYLCLPIISYHISACMWTNSDLLARKISEEPEHFIELAYTLRNKTLFRECAIHIAGHMKFQQPGPHGLILYNGTFPGVTNPKILEVLKIMRERVTGQLLETQMNVLISCAGDSDYLKILSTPIPDNITIPAYYRGLPRDHRLQGLVERLMENHLVFNVNSFFEAGKLDSVGADHFYCGTLDDEELPWDVNETDDLSEVPLPSPSKKAKIRIRMRIDW